MSTVSKENYLKAVFSHNNDSGKNTATSTLAATLNVSNAAISEMAKKLSGEGLLTHEKYKGVGLTNEGQKIALQVLRRHRLWELFLIEILGLDLGKVHDEADNLEHSTSDFLIDKIDDYLGNPKYDPHGHPIPQKDGSIPTMPKSIVLQEVEKDTEYMVVSFNDRDSDLVKYISALGIKLRKKMLVVDKLSFDNSIIVKIDGNNHSLSQFVSKNIFVTKVK